MLARRGRESTDYPLSGKFRSSARKSRVENDGALYHVIVRGKAANVSLTTKTETATWNAWSASASAVEYARSPAS